MRFKDWVKIAPEEEIVKLAAVIVGAIESNGQIVAEQTIEKLAEEGVVKIEGDRNTEQVVETGDRPDFELMKEAIAEAVQAGSIEAIVSLVSSVGERFGAGAARIAISNVHQATQDAMIAGKLTKEQGAPLLKICKESLSNDD